MTLVHLDDGRAAEIVKQWNETTYFNGSNRVGSYTHEEFRHADLGLSKTGAWVLLRSSQSQGAHDTAEEITAAEAAGWFAACSIELPDELDSAVV